MKYFNSSEVRYLRSNLNLRFRAHSIGQDASRLSFQRTTTQLLQIIFRKSLSLLVIQFKILHLYSASSHPKLTVLKLMARQTRLSHTTSSTSSRCSISPVRHLQAVAIQARRVPDRRGGAGWDR